jgi:hypothetical protein
MIGAGFRHRWSAIGRRHPIVTPIGPSFAADVLQLNGGGLSYFESYLIQERGGAADVRGDSISQITNTYMDGLRERSMYLMFRGHLQKRHDCARNVLQISNEIFGGFPYRRIGREGLLQHNVQLLHVHVDFVSLRFFTKRNVAFSMEHNLQAPTALTTQRKVGVPQTMVPRK